MGIEISKIFKDIFKFAIYDKDTDAYYLSKMDYEILGLSDKSIRRKIILMCDELNINLQYPNKPLPEIQDEDLFDEYNDIQLKLKDNPLSKDLIDRKYELRNKITEDNLELIKVIINRRICEIHNNIDREDIYQFGYLLLVKYIDESYLDKENLKFYINCRLILYVETQILHSRNNIGSYQNEQVSKLKDTIDDDPYLTSSELAHKLNLKESQIRVLTNLDNILSSISTDEFEYLDYDESTDEEMEQNKKCMPLLCDCEYEEKLIERLEITEYVNLIVATLPKDRQNILNLYYGLNGCSKYNMEQIAKMCGITKARVSSIIIESFEIIRNSLRGKYLKEYLEDIYEIDEMDVLEQNDKMNLEYEERLIRNLSVEIINKIMEYLNYEQRRFLSLYCENEEYSIRDIALKLDVSVPYAYKIKKSIIKITRIVLLDLISFSSGDIKITYDIYYQYIKYMTNLYLHQIKIRKRG